MTPEQNGIPAAVTCITEGNFTQALTYGQIYQVLAWDTGKRQIKVQGDNRRVHWFPEGYLSQAAGSFQSLPILFR